MYKNVYRVVILGVLLLVVLLFSLPVRVEAAPATGAYFESKLEGTPLPYQDLYNETWGIYAGSVFGDPTSDYYKAIWTICLFLTVLGVFFLGASSFKKIAYYWFMVLVFMTPIFGGRYLFPYICDMLDKITLSAVDVIIVGGSSDPNNQYHAQNNGDFDNVGAMPRAALRNVLENKSMAENLIHFREECWDSAVERAKNNNQWDPSNPPDALSIDYYTLTTKQGSFWSFLTGYSEVPCSSYVTKLKNEIGNKYVEELDNIKTKYESMLAYNIAQDAQKLFDELENADSYPDFTDKLFLQALGMVGNIGDRSSGSNNYYDSIGKPESVLFAEGLGTFLRETGGKLMAVPSLWGLMFKIYSLVHLVSRYLPDFIGSMKVFVIVAFFVAFGFSLIMGNPKWLIDIIGVWLFLDSLYIANAVASRVRYQYMFDINGFFNVAIENIGGFVGADAAVVRGGIAYLAVMLAAVALSGLISWKTISLAGAFTSSISGGAAPKATHTLRGPFRKKLT